MSPEPLIVMDPDLDPEKRTIPGPDIFNLDTKGRPVPFFTVNELARFVFGTSPDWVRWRIRERMFTTYGDPEDCPHGVKYDTGEKDTQGRPVMDTHWWGFDEESRACDVCGAVDTMMVLRYGTLHVRLFTLWDIENLAHAGGARQVISGSQVNAMIRLCRAIAEAYHYI